MSLVLAVALLALVPGIASAENAAGSVPSSPGRLVDVGGYRLHVWCTGRGAPTVVLIAGATGFSFDWALVQPALAKETRVCSCDRGGAAWSDLGPRPRTKSQEAFNLRRALAAAGESGPFVLVGQSMGGDVARLFAADHPQEVAGVVLVDSATPEELTNLNGKVGTTLSFSRGRPIPARRESVTTADLLTERGVARIREAVAKQGLQPSIDPPFDRLPLDVQRWRLWALDQPKRFIAIDSEFIGEEAERIHADSSKAALGAVPLVVLCRDTTVEKSHTPMHARHQQSLARLSLRGEFQMVPGGGHHLHVDRPEAVIAAVRRVIEKSRGRASSGARQLDE